MTKISIFLIPFWLVLISFFVFDPFKILYNHGEKIFVSDGTPDGFTLNRDFVGTEMFKKKKDSLLYDSFIFGSSRSTVFLSNKWANYIENQSVPFHFIGSGESLFGLYSKVKYLDKIGHQVENALLVFDHELLSKTENGDGVISIRHPDTSKEPVHFYFTHLKEYITTNFFIQYLDYKFFGTKRGYMDKLFDNHSRGMRFDSYKNDWIHEGKEISLKKDSVLYYKKKEKIFYSRPTSKIISSPIIQKRQLQMLKEIHSVFKKRGTNYSIIISPLYDQLKLPNSDIKELKSIFGSKNVFDFSGKNSFTDFKGNYYETSHYKPFIADSIMKFVYN